MGLISPVIGFFVMAIVALGLGMIWLLFEGQAIANNGGRKQKKRKKR